MQRHELWRALRGASDAVATAFLEWTRANTPANRFRMEQAARDYVKCLTPVIGPDAVSQFEASFQNHLESLDRVERFQATLAGRSVVDDSDAEMLRLLAAKSETDLRAFVAVQATVLAKLDEVAARDERRKG